MKQENFNIGIFGIGAIGSLMGKYLKRIPNARILYFSRRNKKRIKLHFRNEIEDWNIQLENIPTFDEKLDFLFICLKEYHYSTALDDIDQIINKKTILITLRNGIHLKDSFDARFDHYKIIPGMIDCSVKWVGDQHYEYFTPPKIRFPKSENGTKVYDLLSSVLKDVQVIEDFHTTSWMKLIESACLGSIMVLAGEPAQVFSNVKVMEFYQAMLEEAIKVARKDGAKIPSSFQQELLEKVKHYPASKGSSMLTDLEMGRPLELGAKNQIIVDIANRYSLAVPLQHLILRILKKM